MAGVKKIEGTTKNRSLDRLVESPFFPTTPRAMVKYSREPENSTKSCKARGSDLRVHFKNTCVTADALRSMTLKKAKGYLEDVLQKKQAIPFRFFNGCVGRHAQAKNAPGAASTQCRWPTKSVKFLLHLLKNAESNAEVRAGLQHLACGGRCLTRGLTRGCRATALGEGAAGYFFLVVAGARDAAGALAPRAARTVALLTAVLLLVSPALAGQGSRHREP